MICPQSSSRIRMVKAEVRDWANRKHKVYFCTYCGRAYIGRQVVWQAKCKTQHVGVA